MARALYQLHEQPDCNPGPSAHLGDAGPSVEAYCRMLSDAELLMVGKQGWFMLSRVQRRRARWLMRGAKAEAAQPTPGRVMTGAIEDLMGKRIVDERITPEQVAEHKALRLAMEHRARRLALIREERG